MKSVCILLQNHYEIDIRVRRKAEALAAAGYAVDVLALRTPGSREKVFELNGVSVQTVALGKERGSLARYFLEYVLFFLWCFWKLVGLMGRQQYAVVDVNNLPDFLVFAAAYARWKGAKIVLDMHEITPEFYISKYGVKESSWTVRLLKWSERISFEYADHVITINEPIRDLLVSRGLSPHKCSIVMNSADESLFPAPAGRAAVARPPEAAKFVMMYHGTLTRIYGLDIAVEAFARVHQQMPEAEMIILGGGPEKARLEQMIRELGLEQKARLAGVVRPEAVPQWVSRCDAAVLATRRDVFLDYSFSNKLSEYVIMGKPVIASRLKTIRHYFSEDALAYFEPNNPEDLSRQMLRLYRDPALCARLAQSARREYAPICWEVMKSGYLEMMRGFLEADRAAQDARMCGGSGMNSQGVEKKAKRPGLSEAFSYVLVSPVRNEEAFIEQTIISVLSQTVRPLKWVIVNDGSTDRTEAIASRYSLEHNWIELVRMPERKERHFAGKVLAFNAGYERVKDLPYEFIGNLDGDVSFEADYIEFLLKKLAGNCRLGVVGTNRWEGGIKYDYRFTSDLDVAGACQFFRRQCFEEIGGYVPVKGGGIDLVAVLSARMHGWETKSFSEKIFVHHRKTSTANHPGLRAHYDDGRKDYMLGCDPVWECFRAAYRMTRRPLLICGCMLLAGYTGSMLGRVKHPISKELVRFRRGEQRLRLRRFLAKLVRFEGMGSRRAVSSSQAP